MFKNRFAGKHLDFTDLITEAAVAVYMLVIINGYVALSQLNTEYYYIVTVDIGACIGWGLIDGFTYALGNSIDRGNQNSLLKRLKTGKDRERSVDEVVKELDATFVSQFSESAKRDVASKVLDDLADSTAKKPGFMTKEDLAGLASILEIYVVAGIAMSVSYIIVPDKFDAWLVSNLIGVAWLFSYGYNIGKLMGRRRIPIALLTSVVGIVFLVISYLRYA
jgi:hypothetical protein